MPMDQPVILDNNASQVLTYYLSQNESQCLPPKRAGLLS